MKKKEEDVSIKSEKKEKWVLPIKCGVCNEFSKNGVGASPCLNPECKAYKPPKE